jgi:putative FmdB family regulatory protein
MPIYDYKCSECGTVTEKIKPATCAAIQCPECLKDSEIEPRLHVGIAYRQLSTPAAFRFPDMATLNKKRQRIKEPIWRYPDGHYESINSANTRPEE